MKFIKFECVDRLLLALFGHGWRGQAGRRRIDPVDDGLVMDADEPSDASEVDAIDVHAQSHLPFVGLVAFVFGFWGVSASAVLAVSSGASAGIGAGFGLPISGLTGWTGQTGVVGSLHKTIITPPH